VPKTKSSAAAVLDVGLSDPRWLETFIGLALGASGGLLQSVVLKTSLFSGGLLGAAFGLAFGLFFARRATSPGA